MFIYVYWFSVNWKYVYECNENAIKYVYKCSLISRSVSIIIMIMKNNASLSTSPKLYFLKHTNIYIYNLHISAWLSQQQTHTLVKNKHVFKYVGIDFPHQNGLGWCEEILALPQLGVMRAFSRGVTENPVCSSEKKIYVSCWESGQTENCPDCHCENEPICKMCCLNIPHGKLCRQS